MRWVITLSGKKWEVERLASESLPGLSADAAAPGQLFLELHDPEGDITDEDAALHAAKTAIDTSVRHINGFGRLRWGRVFEGVSVSAIKSFDQVGDATQRVFADPATEHMLPEDFADIVEASGHPKPPLPVGIDVINALDGAAVTALAEANPEVGRVLHLIALMLDGDEEIDWVAGYSALEAIEQDLASREMSGQALGWWTKSERNNFTATANSVEVLGFHARHGKRFGLTEARMTSKDASWFVRRVAAQWLTDLLPARTRRGLLDSS